MRKSFTTEEARSFVDRTAPKLGCGDFTYTPTFPDKVTNVCLVSCLAENGSSYGYSIVYVVWKNSKGVMCKRELADTRSTKDYLYYKDVKIEKDELHFTIQESGSFSGKPSEWKETVRLEDLD